ncbi:hypothetical protein BAUCODRAFT_28808 [Baudoinia panamericana UAMH 10762]|uniref:N-acetyltransferase domain-containing protein n=1 Tax=Baudoinia panamericana (strain UAMH 10762) TaxID=717646 RepID=M2N8I3_BAUPA|nr:uncharacterized protein BAUCODRAFT_28808 [Baudoinia panamericana UAMH 10762]EMD00454.1 hypothetical protein BAUCODRAFT_28808 [Baudoinia panamericana UAMH 10762]
MPVKILEAEDADMKRVFECAALAFDRNEPFFDIIYPKHWLDTGRTQGGERMCQIKNSDPHTTFLKAVDEESGVIMGMAKWNVYAHNTLPDLSAVQYRENLWDSDDGMAYASTLVNVFLKERNAAIRQSGGNLVSLDILAIDPKYQRRGVGDALVKWGTGKADELGVQAVVESSVFGKGLYEKNGFVFIKDVKVEAPEPWLGRDAGQFAWLIRPKKS